MMDLWAKADIKEDLKGAIDHLQSAAAKSPSRQLSLAITNAEQAYHWVDAIHVDGDE